MTLLNSEGSLPKHAEPFETLITKKVDAIIIAMGKPVEADAQFQAAKEKGSPVSTVQSGSSQHALFDIQTNEYKVGAEAALYLLGARQDRMVTIEEWTDLARAVAACQERKTADYLTEHDLEDIAERYALEWDEATDGALPTLDDE